MEQKIGIIGYGSMGKMLLEKFLETKTVDESNLFVSNRTYEKIINLTKIYPKINICRNNIDVVKNADMFFICVKPFETKALLLEIINDAKEDAHIISINGAILFKYLEQICKNRKLSIIIPSVTAEVNKSVTLISHNNYVNDYDKNNIKRLLECFGTVTKVSETEIGTDSELTSCMPGYIAAIFEVITDVAEKHIPVNKEQIIQMVTETMYGAGKLLLEKRMTFDNLVNKVATKGGITEEGVKIIREQLPKTINEMFEKTLEKRRWTTEMAQKDFYHE